MTKINIIDQNQQITNVEKTDKRFSYVQLRSDKRKHSCHRHS